MFPAYQVSDTGLVRRVVASTMGPRLNNRPLKPCIDKKGYLSVCLYGDGKKNTWDVNVLVLLAFAGPKPTPKHQAAHYPDRNPANNHYSNLRWATARENHKDKTKHTRQLLLNKLQVLIDTYGVPQSVISGIVDSCFVNM